MNPMNMEDVGRRIDHLMDLQKLWSDGLALLTRPDIHHSPVEDSMAKQLKICLEHLAAHMAKDYGMTQVKYAEEINKIGTTPPPEENKE